MASYGSSQVRNRGSRTKLGLGSAGGTLVADKARLCGVSWIWPAEVDRGTVYTGERVIGLGRGELRADEGHVYNIPAPPAMHAHTVMRRLTVTLAWFTH